MDYHQKGMSNVNDDYLEGLQIAFQEAEMDSDIQRMEDIIQHCKDAGFDTHFLEKHLQETKGSS